MDKEETVKSLVNIVNSTTDVSILKNMIARFPKVAIEWYVDEQDLDILHHAIISNNIEAISLFFTKGIFKVPHESPSFSYIHLAAKLGRKTILSILLQERKEDNVSLIFTYRGVGDNHVPNADEKKTPLDIAAENGHVGCVHTILDYFYGSKLRHGKTPRKEAYVNLACQLDSPPALRLLLSEKPTTDEIRSAVEAAMKLARPECLDVLLRLGTDISSLFGGMNLYHVLFSYSLSFDKKWHESLLAVTAVLLRHSHSLMQCVPFRTYPLYSLIAHPSCLDLDSAAPYLLACLLLLLNAGANPNFDEILFEKELAKANMQAAYGRCAFSSSFHCLFHTVGKYADQIDHTKQEQKLSLRNYMNKCTEALLKHGADLRYVCRVEDEEMCTSGNALHCFCRIAPKIGINERYLRVLLRNGANPDDQISGQYPLNVFYEELLEIAVDSDFSHIVDIEHSTTIMDSMTFFALANSFKTFTKAIEDKQSASVKIDKIVSQINTEFENRLGCAWSLRKCSVFAVWVGCKRKMANVMKLPLPRRLRDCISETPLLCK